MPAHKVEPTALMKLRSDAEMRLKNGSAPRTAGWSVGVNALGMLHELAGRPDTAVDALKLLHELQVYQIELDLQHEQIEASQRDLIEDLARYRNLYECAPVTYLTLSAQGDILECNAAGARLFEVSQEELRGRSVETFLAPASRPVLQQLLHRLRPGGASGSCEVELKSGYGAHKVQAVASAAPAGNSIAVVFVDLPARR
jgi:PAS domain S-box-containing protein